MTVARRARSTDSRPIDAPGRRRLPILLRHAWYGLNQAFRRRIAHLGITPDQFTVMRTLLESGGITQSELTEQMSSDPNTVASLLERMEKSGLLERRAHEKDRRAHRLDLQADGKRKYQKAREVAIALQTEVLSVLPEDQREEFLEHLARVADVCREVADRSHGQAILSRPSARQGFSVKFFFDRFQTDPLPNRGASLRWPFKRASAPARA